jgi:hypothetical protein
MIPVRQRAQLSPPPVSSFGSKRRGHTSGRGSGLPLSGFVTGGRPGTKEHFLIEERNMKSQNPKTDTQNTPSTIFQSEVLEEKGQNGPTLGEIRHRAFEIHIERGGIHGCDLDDWLQAKRELQEKYNKINEGRQKKK